MVLSTVTATSGVPGAQLPMLVRTLTRLVGLKPGNSFTRFHGTGKLHLDRVPVRFAFVQALEGKVNEWYVGWYIFITLLRDSQILSPLQRWVHVLLWAGKQPYPVLWTQTRY